MILTITGHRPNKLGSYGRSPLQEWIRVKIAERFVELKPEKIITGMALGVDQWSAEIAIDAGIPFIAALPCRNQSQMWPLSSHVKWQVLLKQAVEIELVTDAQYSPQCMQARNEWMVDNGTDVLAVWDGTPGGTGNCVRYAKAQDRPIHLINPTAYPC